jgi:hypothetical protein
MNGRGRDIKAVWTFTDEPTLNESGDDEPQLALWKLTHTSDIIWNRNE